MGLTLWSGRGCADGCAGECAAVGQDIVALQEFDFSSEFSDFSALYDGMLGARYERFEKPRTGGSPLAALLSHRCPTDCSALAPVPH